MNDVGQKAFLQLFTALEMTFLHLHANRSQIIKEILVPLILTTFSATKLYSLTYFLMTKSELPVLLFIAKGVEVEMSECYLQSRTA